VFPFVILMKSSMNTSMTVIVPSARGIPSVKWALSIILPSKMCSGRQCFSSSAWMVSLAVSDAAQKNGGDSHHPICRALATTVSILSTSMSSFSEGSS